MMKYYVKNGYKKVFHTLDSDAPNARYLNQLQIFLWIHTLVFSLQVLGIVQNYQIITLFIH